ncbi:MAG: site-2 protease family protein, partial [Alphaproteobacteria bacterium]|nr:site-2 protease family protein [Alphaproteobacteria bacterium]
MMSPARFVLPSFFDATADMEIINLIITGNYIVPFLIAITVLVFVHEMGHFLAARRAGVDVQVFSVGIGPKLFGRVDRHGTLWQVAALPIGGYVKMRGQSDVGNDVSADTSPGSFVVTSLRARAGVVFAGPLANFVLAFVLLFGLYVGFGQYTPSDDGEWVVIQLVPGAPAERAGILPNDKIHSINGKTMQVYDDLINAVRDSGGDPVNVSVSRQNGVEQIQVQPAQITLDDGTQVWRIGLAARQLAFVALGPIQAVVTSFRVLYDIIVLTLSAVGEIIIGE